MSNFDQWKARLEAAASAHADPRAQMESLATAEAVVRGRAYRAIVKLVEMYFDEYPEDEALRLSVEYLHEEIDRATTACKNMVRDCPESADWLLDYWDKVIFVYKDMIAVLETA